MTFLSLRPRFKRNEVQDLKALCNLSIADSNLNLFERTKKVVVDNAVKLERLFDTELGLFIRLMDPHGQLFINPLADGIFKLVYIDAANDYYDLLTVDKNERQRFINAMKPFGSPYAL